MIEFIAGDFFKYDADIRINAVNCVGVMGAGVALLFKNKYPDMFTEYREVCQNNEVQPGKPHVWQNNDIIIINFPTKIHWKNPSKYEYIEKGLMWLRGYLSDKENLTLTLPALGCGYGGLEWKKVKDIINNYLSEISINIFAFEPK